MDLKYLITFKTILETGSFINAARALNYTQSTVTFQIQQLEQELSVQLFEKIGRKMVITQAGKDVLPFIDAILQSVEQIMNYGKNLQDITGSLKISMPETLLTYKMQPVLKAFREAAPGVKLSLQAMNCYAIRDHIINGGADIGVHYDVGGYGATVVTERMASYPMVLVASPALDRSQRDFLSQGQRKSISIITNDRQSIWWGIFERYLKERGIVPDGILELGSIEAIKRSVMSNLGVAFLPRFVAEEELSSGALEELETGLLEKKITAICSYHKNKWITPAMELFIRLLHESL